MPCRIAVCKCKSCINSIEGVMMTRLPFLSTSSLAMRSWRHALGLVSCACCVLLTTTPIQAAETIKNAAMPASQVQCQSSYLLRLQELKRRKQNLIGCKEQTRDRAQSTFDFDGQIPSGSRFLAAKRCQLCQVRVCKLRRPISRSATRKLSWADVIWPRSLCSGTTWQRRNQCR